MGTSEEVPIIIKKFYKRILTLSGILRFHLLALLLYTFQMLVAILHTS
jgi:hypothetical protein